ncbi:MAG: VIT domain-containing protein [Thermomicrobiales bacterium]
MFNRTAYWNSRAGGVALLEVVEPADQPGARRFVPLRRTELRGEIVGPLAALRLVHRYGYTREQCAQTLEAIYRFPLPGDAAVTGVTVRFGEVEIAAELQERALAEATSEEAQAQGQQAALATRESPDVFTLRIAGLQPDQEVTVETRYVQLARAEGSEWALRVPLTIGPRYVREDERGSRQAEGQPLALLRDPGHRFALDLTLREVGEVRSGTHALAIGGDDAGGLRVRLRDEEVLPDRDCVIAWQPRREATRPSLHALVHDDREDKHVYFLALVAPPRAVNPAATVAREVVLLVDHSGSMGGPKWEASDWAVKSFLGGLTERDRFGLGLFHNDARWFDKATPRATPEMVGRAIDFLIRNRDSGGTNLGVALEQALDLKRAAGEYARHLLVVTDAQVSDAGRILRLADDEAQRADRRRISVLCIDAAPNDFLATELAERGGGVSRFLTSSPEEDDIATALDAVLEDWAAPVLTGLRLTLDRGMVETGDGVARTVEPEESAIDLGDLPTGRAVWVVGRFPRTAGGELTLRLAANRDPGVPVLRINLATEARELPALKALFGARRVAGLEFLTNARYGEAELRDQLARLGYDPARLTTAQPNRVYAENTRRDATEGLRELLVGEALRYGLASAETAFVAVRREKGKVVEGTVAVGNALPSGWSDSFLTLAGGAPPMMMAMAAPMAMPSAPMPERARAITTGMHGARPDAPWPAGSAPARGGGFFSKLAGAVGSALSGGGNVPTPPTPAMPTAPGEVATPVAPPSPSLFAGVPVFAGGEAVLFDSGRPGDVGKLSPRTLTRLRLRADGAGDPGRLDGDLAILIYVGDLAAPRARVRVADLLRQGGERPLHLAWEVGQVLRVVLQDPRGAWAQQAPKLELILS